jgi:hypothetical protein
MRIFMFASSTACSTATSAGGARFHAATEPTRSEMESIVRHVHKGVGLWLARRCPSKAAPATAPLEACVALRRGNVARTPAIDEGAAEGALLDDQPPPGRAAVDFECFNLNASVAIAADDDRGRERLMRYGARPPFALENLRLMSGGRVAFRIKMVTHGARARKFA